MASVSQLSTKRSEGWRSVPAAGALQALADLAGAGRLGARPGRGDQAEVLAQDRSDAGEAAVGVAATEPRLERGERLGARPALTSAKASRRWPAG